MVIDDRFYSLSTRCGLCLDCSWRDSCTFTACDSCDGFFPLLNYGWNPSYWQEMSYRRENAMNGITIGERMWKERKG